MDPATTQTRSVAAYLVLILILYVAGPNFRYSCDGRGVRACELGGAWGGDQTFEVPKRGGLHLVVTEVVPVAAGADNNNNNNNNKKEFL